MRIHLFNFLSASQFWEQCRDAPLLEVRADPPAHGVPTLVSTSLAEKRIWHGLMFILGHLPNLLSLRAV